MQRLGPSTGVPSVGLAEDMVQVARGSHGDYQIIALCSQSPQEMFELTVRAFNLVETLRLCTCWPFADKEIRRAALEKAISETVTPGKAQINMDAFNLGAERVAPCNLSDV